MNKGSHLGLAQFLMEKEAFHDISKYKKSFLIGNILPDCRPSFLTTRHTIYDTFDLLKSEIKCISDGYNKEKGITAYFCRHLGIILHYIADYFTFPHNPDYHGSVKEHVEYEKQLAATFSFGLKDINYYLNTPGELGSTDEYLITYLKCMRNI